MTLALDRTTQSPARLESPTALHYREFQQAFTFYNQRLFEGGLPECLIVMTRKPRSHGYLAPSRWFSSDSGDLVHELGLNPVDFATRETEDVLSTLVHEMCHAWQLSHGERVPRPGYHNREWADKMEEIGLVPSHTGQPEGKRTGQSVSHYIDTGGEFHQQTVYLLDTGWTIPHIDIPESSKRRSNRPKYICAECGLKAWGKSGLALRCENCDKSLAEETPEEGEEES